MRRYLDGHGYVEVETPMLTPKATGAAARPFKTHHNALDIDLYARIAPELYLKRLVVGGFEKVYELNRNFRNEGIDRTHNPEFTMLEIYAAYMNADGMMDMCEEMLRRAVGLATGSSTVSWEFEIDFGKPFSRLAMQQAIAEHWPEEWRTLGGEVVDSSWFSDTQRLSQMHSFWKAMLIPGSLVETEWQKVIDVSASAGVELSHAPELRRANEVVELFEGVAEEKLIQPTFITNFPKVISPLSKASPVDPDVAERFELFIGGLECANGFSELNDPVEQYERFMDQAKQRESGDEEAMVLDEDYIRALSYGMPPAAGIGIGIDRMVMLLTNRPSIRDVILFPHMRPE
jgi:lysyl-tRNA synthetase class 2